MRNSSRAYGVAACGILAAWVLSLGGADAAGAADTTKPAVKMQAAAEFPHAGISLAVPEKFEFQPLTEPWDVCHATLMDAGKTLQGVTLSAYPVAAEDKDGQPVTAEKFADGMIKEVQKSLAVSHFKLGKTATIPIAGIDGTVRVMRYSFRGAQTAAAQVYFIREEKNPLVPEVKVRLCYVISAESSPEKEASLLTVLGEIIKSTKLTKFARPSALDVKDFEAPMKDFKLGFSVSPPKGWYVNLVPSGVEIAQTDYLLIGETKKGKIQAPAGMPLVRVCQAEMAGQSTAQDIAAKEIQARQKVAASANLEIEVLSKGEAKMAGVDGYEFVLRQAAVKAATTEAATAPAADEPATFIVQRTIVAAGDSGPSKSYYIRVHLIGDSAKPAQALMEKLSEKFELLGPETAPASGPATAPAATTKYSIPDDHPLTY